MTTPVADPLVGKTIGQYEIVARLGGGGMGVVYKARDAKLGRVVALKFLPPQWSHDESAKQRFIREAQAASATDHRNICTIHDIGSTDDGQLFIVMAFYDGQTLKQKLEAGALPTEEAIEIAAQLAEGLAKAHAHGVVHRDIKPGNVIVTDDAVKILDFGLAKFADARFKLTLEGSTLGTIAYMSPEQTRGDEADARSDIWAVGVVLYEMLTGRLPFTGGYPEAIAHAIKNDSPPPLRGQGRDVSESLEQTVFRALHKEPNVRFQTARDLARALRLLQGRTLPVELRTETLDFGLPPSPPGDLRPSQRGTEVAARGDGGRRRVRRLAIAATVLLVLAVAAVWVFWPIERVPVAVAPVVNQTGYAELDPYRMALTQSLTAALSDSDVVRPIPYERLLQIVQQYRGDRRDVTSSEALRAISMNSGARVVLVPTLLYENGAWKAKVEFQSAQTAATEGAYETDTVVSSLAKDTAYELLAPLAGGIAQHFAQKSIRTSIARRIRNAFDGDRVDVHLPTADLEGASAYEQALAAYEDLEYAASLEFLTAASQQDQRNPLLLAWRSRVARIMRRDNDAAELAQRAVGLLSQDTPTSARLFTEAVAAESLRQRDTALARYRDLVDLHADDPAGRLQLAAFQDRQGMTADAIAAYHQALAADNRLARPHLELCRLYNRINDSANAREHGRLALDGYRALGARGGEAQALFCLTDSLRIGRDDERAQAARHADSALAILRDLNYPYNLSRAHNYVALAAEARGNYADAAAAWEQSLTAARAVGNLVLEPLVLMNLGVTYAALGNRARALEYDRESAKLYARLGDQSRAAEIEANIGHLLIEYGNPEEGIRALQNALGVFRKLGNRNFELFGSQATATYYRHAGRHEEAERELTRSLALARERSLEDEIATSLIGLARLHLERGDYRQSRELLLRALADASGREHRHARLRLAQTYTRLGEFAAAQTELDRAAAEMQNHRDSGLLPALHLARGQLAFAMGRAEEALGALTQADALWTDALPDPETVEARAYLGLLHARLGRFDAGHAALRAALVHADKVGHVSLQALCRIFLAQAHAARGRFDEALRQLDAVPPDTTTRRIAADLRTQHHYWRSVVIQKMKVP